MRAGRDELMAEGLKGLSPTDCTFLASSRRACIRSSSGFSMYSGILLKQYPPRLGPPSRGALAG